MATTVTLEEQDWESLLTIIRWAETEHADDGDTTATITALRTEIKDQLDD